MSYSRLSAAVALTLAACASSTSTRPRATQVASHVATPSAARGSGAPSAPPQPPPTAPAPAATAQASESSGFERTYRGTIAGKPVQAKLKRAGEHVEGAYRYGRALQDLLLSGKVDQSGGFELEERNEQGKLTGHWQGAQLEPSKVVGTWSSPDGAKTHPIDLKPGEFIELVKIGSQLRIFPVKDGAATGTCSWSVTFPQLSGGPDKALERLLNGQLRALGSESVPSFCNDQVDSELGAASASRSYAVTAVRPPYVGLRFDYEMYSGGAHGIHGTDCHVFDAYTGQTFTLTEKLGQPQRERLSELLNRAKNAAPTELERSGAITAQLAITDQSTICLASDGVVIQLADYELGGYAFGRPAFAFAAAQVRSLFDPALARELFPE